MDGGNAGNAGAVFSSLSKDSSFHTEISQFARFPPNHPQSAQSSSLCSSLSLAAPLRAPRIGMQMLVRTLRQAQGERIRDNLPEIIPSPSAQRANQMHCVAISNGVREHLNFFGIHKEADVLADAILLIEHSKSHANIALI
jgi:hypothetical protein